MKQKTAIKLDLLPAERSRLKANKIRFADISDYSVDELTNLLQIDQMRAMEIHALVEFQRVPSIGVRFAHDLISMGYYSLDELKDKEGSRLTDEFEQQNGYWIDPCVEDQFRLVVDYANNRNLCRQWWDYTAERKEFRAKQGYPPERPSKAWFDRSA